ncbi:YceK/YidQ family lipoprotein [Marinobacter sp. F4206]|uniref:YceK/YidQ family lipoprotein n=1 Tax=Marinobacter sp. F4206 TaxID=2861777 RepID=UPI001C5F7B12|nr:YceK/YidQ family lipoprotein [Marinobacter sp. F4206]MBW4935564.1 YceK/YidQ family lipoprotein [Marinobacter sp. F4206]
MKHRLIISGILILTLTGCGTVNTVVWGDAVTVRNLKQSETKCDSIPRVYSGVAYDFCKLSGEPAPVHTWRASSGTPGSIIDMLFSGILDTVALPYTIYRQSRDGNISIR